MEFNGFIVRNLKNECHLMFLLQFLFFAAFGVFVLNYLLTERKVFTGKSQTETVGITGE